MNMQGVGSSSFKNSDFYSYLKDYQSHYPWKALLMLSPYFVQITDVIGSSINIYFEIGNPISEYHYYYASIISQIISITGFLFWLFINNEPTQIYKTYEFYFFLHIFLRFLQTLSLVSSNETLSNFVKIFGLAEIVVLIVFFLVNDHSGKNSIYRILYSDGYFREDGKYVVSVGIMNNKKIIDVFTKVMIWLFILLMISAAWSLLGMMIQELLLTESKNIKSKSENQATLDNQAKVASQIPLSFMFLVLVQAPIIEELLYRQIFMRILGSNMTATAISAFVFAIIHVRHKEPLHILMSYMSGALVLSLIYYKYKNLSINIMLHFTINFYVLINMMIKSYLETN